MSNPDGHTEDPAGDPTLHVAVIRHTDDSLISLLCDTLTAAGCLVLDGSFYLIDKQAIVSPFPMDEATFEKIDAAYYQGTHRRLRVPDSVVAGRQFAYIQTRLRELVAEELEKKNQQQ